MRNKGTATLRDVAHAAGVSPYTVSAVLNGARSNTRVSDATRRRILESAAGLQYQPNAMARGLAKRRSNTLGVFFGLLHSTEALANSYASGLLQGIVTGAAARGFDVLLYTEDWINAAQSANRFRDGRADGMVLIAPLLDTDIISGITALPVPTVLISPNPQPYPNQVACIDVDNALGIKLAVKHLVALGHRRIAHLMGNANVASVPLRRAAFEAAMAEVQLPVPPEYLVAATYDGRILTRLLPPVLNLPEPPTALVAGNDNLAIAAVATAREMGLSVPGDLSVVGFDDISAASQVTPQLTTIHQPLREIGAEAAQLLVERIERPPEYPNHALSFDCALIAPRLVVRESTALPPQHRRR